ncbi:hypothetical protein NDN08_006599 [Rhodosorus marinus]|uniref:Fatty acid hydroxylase domain-containing protein n=1 Tax=Rhodosorus marinus TaxID=101924 RepID=A0AAV8UL49_9RHOD|nr:hypothetical protein NDN08_006599 [Rhodosorus marinus]
MLLESTFAFVLLSRGLLQDHWTWLLSNYGTNTIAFVGLAFSLLFGYFLGCLPYLLLDKLKIPFLAKYKVQQHFYPDEKMEWNASQVCLGLFLYLMFPMIYLFVRQMGLLQIRVDSELPSAMELLTSQVYFFVAEDFLNYWLHRWLHSKWAYNKIHYMHHEHTAPFALSASYAHPIEVIILGIPTFTGPVILSPHLFTLWLWLMLRTYEAIDIHSGYDLPWSANKYFKFYAGTEHHDYHHFRFSGNFASIFTWCDKLYGTDLGYESFKAQKNE